MTPSGRIGCSHALRTTLPENAWDAARRRLWDILGSRTEVHGEGLQTVSDAWQRGRSCGGGGDRRRIRRGGYGAGERPPHAIDRGALWETRLLVHRFHGERKQVSDRRFHQRGGLLRPDR